MTSMDDVTSLLAAREDEAMAHPLVLYGLVTRAADDKKDVVMSSTKGLLNIVPKRRVFTVANERDIDALYKQAMEKPIVMSPSARIKQERIMGIIPSSRNERWIIIVNQVHPHIQPYIVKNFEMMKTKIGSGSPFEMVLSFNSCLTKVYNDRLATGTKRRATLVEFEDAEIVVKYQGRSSGERTSLPTLRFEFADLAPEGIHRRTLADAQHESNNPLQFPVKVVANRVCSLFPGWSFDYIAGALSASVDGAAWGHTEPQMGAGVVKIETRPNGSPGIRLSAGRNMRVPSNTSQHGVKCEDCMAVFTPLVKQLGCKNCGRLFCNNCTVTHQGQDYQCTKCSLLLSGIFTKAQLMQWKVKDLKAPLLKQNINLSKCSEKDDLIELLFRHFGNSNGPHSSGHGSESNGTWSPRVNQAAPSSRSSNIDFSTNLPGTPIPSSDSLPNLVPPTWAASQSTSIHSHRGTATSNQSNTQQTSSASSNQYNTQQTSSATSNQYNPQQTSSASSNQSNTQQTNNQSGTSNTQEKQESQPERPTIVLEDIKSEAEIDELNIKCLKRVLLNNFVDYKGCCERWELQERLKRLWRDNEANKQKAEEQRKISDDPSIGQNGTTSNEDDICKICMDAAIDCVLLECGHMVTCTKCGKRLSECPICRQYVIRAVHTFKV